MLRTITKHSVLWIAMAVGVAFALPATAQDDEDAGFSREGPYLGLSGNFVIDQSTKNLSRHPATGNATSHTGGAEIRLGFRLVPEMALELVGDWAYLGGRNPWSTALATKLYVVEMMLDEDDQGGRFQPYVMSSAGIISGDLDKSKDPSASFKFGLGLDFWLTKDLALVTQLAYNFNSGEASRYKTINASLGVNWRY